MNSTSVRPATGLERIVVFVASLEAVPVLRAVFAQLPKDLPSAIVILLHATTGHERAVAHNLNVNSGLLVMRGAEGVQLRNDHAYVVLPAQNLVIGEGGRLISEFQIDADGIAIPRGGDRKAAESEALLASLTARYGAGGVAVALAALTPRETEGFRRVREAKGHTIALDETNRLISDSSKTGVAPGPGGELLPAQAIAKKMLSMLSPSKASAR